MKKSRSIVREANELIQGLLLLLVPSCGILSILAAAAAAPAAAAALEAIEPLLAAFSPAEPLDGWKRIENQASSRLGYCPWF